MSSWYDPEKGDICRCDVEGCINEGKMENKFSVWASRDILMPPEGWKQFVPSSMVGYPTGRLHICEKHANMSEGCIGDNFKLVLIH